MPRIRFQTLAVSLALGLVPGTVPAAPHAFVSVATEPDARAVRVIDLATMTVETTIGNVGDEPGRMVANAARSQIWLSSWRYLPPLNEARVHRIDTALRQVVATAAVGIRQNRTIALSPDESRVYTWKQESVDGVDTIAVAVLDAMTLAEIAVVPISGPSCLQFASQIAVAPDGRIVAAGCSDGLRIIDPLTLVVTIGATPPLSSSAILGFSPDGAEVYVSNASAASNGNAGVRAIDLGTGVGSEFYWSVTGNPVGFPQGSSAVRMIVVQRPADPPGDPTVFFAYDSTWGNPPVAWARSSDLAPAGGPRQRRLIGRASVGPASSLGASVDGTSGLGARMGGIRRVAFGASPGDAVVASDGDIITLAGVGPLTDIIVLPPFVDRLFADDFD
ncbi:MAG: hypothetical protein J0L88_07090 [Xanthomonadales bacterium]|nr:hypothetical protein [Xanthomonadales bacterium]